ncbi:Uncharacterized protein GBIM_11277 [Gryllus bimaculatus]|nr:Uncharacterized protein GBIM_11277 [Gryllus bimaculatus]
MASDKAPAKPASDKPAAAKPEKAPEKAPAGKQPPADKAGGKAEKPAEKTPPSKQEKPADKAPAAKPEEKAPAKADKAAEKPANKGEKAAPVKNQKAEDKPPAAKPDAKPAEKPASPKAEKAEKPQANKPDEKPSADAAAKTDKPAEKAGGGKQDNKAPEKAAPVKPEEGAKADKAPAGKDNKATPAKTKGAPAKAEEKAAEKVDANKQKVPANQTEKGTAEKSAKSAEKKPDKAPPKTEKPAGNQDKSADKKAEKGGGKADVKGAKKQDAKPDSKANKAGENKENKPDNKVATKGDNKAVLKEGDNKTEGQTKEEQASGAAEAENVPAAEANEAAAGEGDTTTSKKKKRGRRGKGKKGGDAAPAEGGKSQSGGNAGSGDQPKQGLSASAKKRNRRKKKAAAAAAAGAGGSAEGAAKEGAPAAPTAPPAPQGKSGEEGPQSQEKKKLQPPNMIKNLNFGSHSSEKKPHHTQNKMLQPDGKTMFQQLPFPEIPPSKPSDAYVDQLTKCLQLLVKAKEGPRPDTDPHHMTDSDDELEYDIVQRTVFLSHACHICKALYNKENGPLRTCDQCKMISYCSEEHRKEHWPVHKDLCQVISRICQVERVSHIFEKSKGLSPEAFRHVRVHYIVQAVGELGRDLELWEKEMFYFCKVCHTCYESDLSKLTACKKCSYVYFCQPNHLKSDHSEWCKDFKLYADLIRYQSHNGMIQPTLPSNISINYTPLAKNMHEHFSSLMGSSILSKALTYSVLTDIATCPMTILFALQNSTIPLDVINSLTIHLVGAEAHFEVDTMKKWEIFIMHFLPQLKFLRVVFVGPELNVDILPEQLLRSGKCCAKCSSTGRSVVYDFQPAMFYHDYVHSKEYCKPDLICAFNAGLYRSTGFDNSDTWPPSINAMLGPPYVPVVVTAYTAEELPLDVSRMEQCSPLKIILPPSRNPFSSSKPSLNFVSDEIMPLIYKNFYISIVQGVDTNPVKC